jgi:hypothetical protein
MLDAGWNMMVQVKGKEPIVVTKEELNVARWCRLLKEDRDYRGGGVDLDSNSD